MGHSRRARAVLTDLLNRGDVTCDTISLLGRTFKETWLRTGSTDALSAATTAYQKAVELAPDNPFPAINRASLSLLAGDTASAHKLAGGILRLYQGQKRLKKMIDGVTQPSARPISAWEMLTKRASIMQMWFWPDWTLENAVRHEDMPALFLSMPAKTCTAWTIALLSRSYSYLRV